jgi:hypothetical protein
MPPPPGFAPHGMPPQYGAPPHAGGAVPFTSFMQQQRQTAARPNSRNSDQPAATAAEQQQQRQWAVTLRAPHAPPHQAAQHQAAPPKAIRTPASQSDIDRFRTEVQALHAQQQAMAVQQAEDAAEDAAVGGGSAAVCARPPDDIITGILAQLGNLFSSDAETIDFMQDNFSAGCCTHIRDFIVDDCYNKCTGKKEAGAGGAAARSACHLMKLCSAGRGTVLVAMINILATEPSACTTNGANSMSAALTSFCPLMRLVFQHFDDIRTTQRGCISLLRILVAASPYNRAVDNFVSTVTTKLHTLIYDQHGNYIVSNLLCNFDRREVEAPAAAAFVGCAMPPLDAETAPLFTPTPLDELHQQTQHVLGLSAKCAPAGAGPLPARQCVVSPSIWRQFHVSLCSAIACDVVAVGTHKAASHVLENALRRVPFDRVPEALPLLHACVNKDVLIALCRHACGHHCVVALAETLVTKGARFSEHSVALCRAQLVKLRTWPEAVEAQYFDKVDVVLRRL